MSVDQKFDPNKHIMVVRDATTGRHVHVAWASVLEQMASVPASAVDLAPVLARLSALERRPTGSADQPEPGLIDSVNEATASLARVTQRLTEIETKHGQLETKHRDHNHNYRLPEDQLQIIASAVLEQMRLAAQRAA